MKRAKDRARLDALGDEVREHLGRFLETTT